MVLESLKKITKKERQDKPKHPVRLGRKLLRGIIFLLGWLGAAVIYYVIFSFFFDTPIESRMKSSVEKLSEEYDKLAARYDTIGQVAGNVADREKFIFRSLFDSDPLSSTASEDRLRRYDSLVLMTDKELTSELADRTGRIASKIHSRTADWEQLMEKVAEKGAAMNNIPSIQPVINKELTLIATSFGLKIQPFYKALVQHNGIDYALLEGTNVFATADGTVSIPNQRGARTYTGTTLTIDHGNGYTSHYNHLDRILVRNGAKVKRGEMIAQSGNTGLSLAPHLHYEVRMNGKPVDPVHYFFYELPPREYDWVQKLASVGMQSLD